MDIYIKCINAFFTTFYYHLKMSTCKLLSRPIIIITVLYDQDMSFLHFEVIKWHSWKRIFLELMFLCCENTVHMYSFKFQSWETWFLNLCLFYDLKPPHHDNVYKIQTILTFSDNTLRMPEVFRLTSATVQEAAACFWRQGIKVKSWMDSLLGFHITWQV